MKEVSGPVIMIALILCAVFVPVAFMGGVTGQLYQQFVITVAVAVVFSAINALTLSPALCAILLKRPTPARGPLGWFFGQFNRGFDRITSGYGGIVNFLIRKAGRSMLLLVAVVGGIWLRQGNFVEVVDQFNDQFTFTDHALGLESQRRFNSPVNSPV